MIFVVIFAWVFAFYVFKNHGEYIDPRYFSNKQYFTSNKKKDESDS